MPIYKYTATNIQGKKEYGMREASDEEKLHELLKAEGLFLLTCKEHVEKKKKHKLTPMEISDFCRNLGSLLGAGVDLARSLQIISQRDVKKHIREIYNEINMKIRQGMSLSDAMEEQGLFPDLMVNMIRASEVSGTLDKTAMNLADHYEKDEELRLKILGSTVYPIILLGLTIVSVFIIFVFIMPRFSDVFTGLELPLPTKIVLGLSSMLRNNLLAIFIIFMSIIFVFAIAWRFREFQVLFDKAKFKIPRIGKLLRIIHTARFARTLNSLYSSGIPMIKCLSIAKNTITNRFIADQFDRVIERVKSGDSLSTSIGMVDGFDIKLSSTISVGEETGRLDKMLEATANSMEYEAEAAMQRITTYLAPALVIFLAVVIGFVVMAVMLPMVNLYRYRY
ncbi:MAG: type II secretion system F family protein [Clostridiaceae bacterium]|nr:type II secretion system F family protein [Clostridiaceae bacterium]